MSQRSSLERKGKRETLSYWELPEQTTFTREIYTEPSSQCAVFFLFFFLVKRLFILYSKTPDPSPYNPSIYFLQPSQYT